MKINLRDLFWLTLLIALACAWFIDHDRIRHESDALQTERERLQALPLQRAELALKIAEAEFTHYKDLRKGSPTAISVSEYRRLEMRRDLAKIDVDTARAKEFAAPNRP